jgi:hypothetical protein
MNPSGSSPAYAPPGSRIVAFGVTRQKLSHRSRHVCANPPTLQDDVLHALRRQLVTHGQPGLPGADDEHIHCFRHRERTLVRR